MGGSAIVAHSQKVQQMPRRALSSTAERAPHRIPTQLRDLQRRGDHALTTIQPACLPLSLCERTPAAAALGLKVALAGTAEVVAAAAAASVAAFFGFLRCDDGAFLELDRSRERTRSLTHSLTHALTRERERGREREREPTQASEGPAWASATCTARNERAPSCVAN